MIVHVLNYSSKRIPSKFVRDWVELCQSELKRKKIVIPKSAQVLNVVFVKRNEVRRLNRQYRKKDYATDVLSFAGLEPGVLGELVVSLDVIQKQAIENRHSLKEELGYMVLHGILHLMGYDHEKSSAEATRMFEIQDDVFEKLCLKLGYVDTSRIVRTKKTSRSRKKTRR